MSEPKRPDVFAACIIAASNRASSGLSDAKMRTMTEAQRFDADSDAVLAYARALYQKATGDEQTSFS